MANLSASIKEFGDTCQRIAGYARGVMRIRDPENLALVNCRDGDARWLEIEPIDVRKKHFSRGTVITRKPLGYQPDFVVVNGVTYRPDTAA